MYFIKLNFFISYYFCPAQLSTRVEVIVLLEINKLALKCKTNYFHPKCEHRDLL